MLTSGLEEVAALVERDDRRHHPREAPWWMTRSYARLILAIAFARLGDRARAIELSAAGPLDDTDDPIHAFLRDVCRWRIDRALAGEPRELPLPKAFLDRLNAAPREQQNKIDRCLDHSPTLCGERWLMHANGVERSVERMRSPAWLQLRMVADPAVQIAKHFDDGAPDDTLDAALRVLGAMPVERAAPVLATVVGRVPRWRPGLCGRACYAAARAGYGELVGELVPEMLEAIDEKCETAELMVVATTAARAFTWLGMTAELAALFVQVTAAVEMADDPWQLQSLRRGLLGAAGIEGAREILESGLATIERGLGMGLNYYGILPRAVAISATYAGAEVGSAVLARLANRYAMTWDDLETNSHFCLTVLHLVESLAMAHVDLALANVNVLDPATQPLLTGFTF